MAAIRSVEEYRHTDTTILCENWHDVLGMSELLQQPITYCDWKYIDMSGQPVPIFTNMEPPITYQVIKASAFLSRKPEMVVDEKVTVLVNESTGERFELIGNISASRDGSGKRIVEIKRVVQNVLLFKDPFEADVFDGDLCFCYHFSDDLIYSHIVSDKVGRNIIDAMSGNSIMSMSFKYKADCERWVKGNSKKTTMSDQIISDGPWIMVSDKLPEMHALGMSQDVLVIAGDRVMVKCYDYELSRWSGSHFITVTHWMPLPPPPNR